MANEPSVLIAVFEDRLEAERALRDLQDAGFKDENLGYVIRGSDVIMGGMITDTAGAKDATGAVTGAITGGMVGGVLGAAAALMVPGVGPVLAGGILASFFGGAIAGTAIGGILGAMTGLGISEEEAKYYEKEFESGKAIVAVRAGARAVEAGEILRRHGGYNLQNRRSSPIDTTGPFSQP